MPNLNAAPDGRAPTFVDRRHQRDFDRDGVVVIPLLSPDALRSLAAAVEPLIPTDPVPMLSPHVGDTVALRRAFAAVAEEHLVPAMAQPMPDQQVFTGSVVVKAPGPGGEFLLHQDWSFVNEERFVSGVVWVPLSDTDADSGGLHVVLGSHRLDTPVRGAPDLGLRLGDTDLGTRLANEYLTPVSAPAGSAVVFNHRLLHGSPVNLSDRPRVAVTVAFHPRGSDLYHHRADGDGGLLRYEVTPEFFLSLDPSLPPTGRHVRGVERVSSGGGEVGSALLGRLAPAAGSANLRRAASGLSGAGPRST